MDDLRLAVRLGRASAAAYTARPVLLLTGLVGAALAVGIEVLGVVLLLGQFGRLGGWDVHEVALLLGLVECGLSFAVAAGYSLETSTFAALVTGGEFDAVLTRPLSPLLWVLSRDVQPRELGRLAVGAATVVWGAHGAGVRWTPAHVGLAVLSVGCCATVLLAIHILGAAVTFRTGQGTEFVNAFIFGGATLASYPLQVFDLSLRVVFTYLVPVALTVYVPALVLLDRPGAPWAGRSLLPLVPVAAAGVLGAAVFAWRGGVNHYQRSGG